MKRGKFTKWEIAEKVVLALVAVAGFALSIFATVTSLSASSEAEVASAPYIKLEDARVLQLRSNLTYELQLKIENIGRRSALDVRDSAWLIGQDPTRGRIVRFDADVTPELGPSENITSMTLADTGGHGELVPQYYVVAFEYNDTKVEGICHRTFFFSWAGMANGHADPNLSFVGRAESVDVVSRIEALEKRHIRALHDDENPCRS